MKLIDALRITNTSRISIVGAGGKTTALIRVGSEWPGRSVQAATAHFGIDQTGFAENHIIWDPGFIPDIRSIDVAKKTMITGPRRDEIILLGVEPSQWKFIAQLAGMHNMPVFLESDGSKTRPLKAPADHEPPIPDWVNHVIVSVGLSVLGKPLNTQNVHRMEIFSSLTGLAENQPITEEAILAMLIHPMGGLKNIPLAARKTVLLNQVDTLPDLSRLPIFEDGLLGTYDSVIFTRLQASETRYATQEQPAEVVKSVEKTAGIILAAGNSKRMGQPKALLDWNGMSFVRACAQEAFAAGLDPILVVAGEEFTEICNAVSGLPVLVIHNAEWQTGQSSSIRAGIRALPENVGGVVFQLVDQPQIPQTLIRKLITEHHLNLSAITLPEAGGRRANPALFDRVTFDELLQIQGDVGGRSIFSRFSIKMIPWNDEGILLDVDTPQDYANLVSSSR